VKLSETTTAPVGRVQIARYACAVGDFNPIHVDEDFAKAAGMPSVIAHGPLTAALIIDAVVGQVGADALAAASIRFRAPVFPGDTLTLIPTEDGAEIRKADGSVAATVTLREADLRGAEA
jgi:acyl dehydratase